MASYWLLKSEPTTYSFSDLQKDKKTNWNGVRNYQARNHLRNMAVGDQALIYHSGDDKAVIGIAKVVKTAYTDHAKDDEDAEGTWSQVDIAPVEKLDKPVTLAEIKASAALKDLALIRQSRLSAMPVSKAHFDKIKAMGSK